VFEGVCFFHSGVFLFVFFDDLLEVSPVRQISFLNSIAHFLGFFFVIFILLSLLLHPDCLLNHRFLIRSGLYGWMSVLWL